MNLVCVLAARFDRTPDGAVWHQTMFAHSFWRRYLDVFSHVRIVARVRDVTAVSPNHKRVDGEGVSVAGAPHYLGPWQYIRKARAVEHAVRHALRPSDAVIMRVACHLAAHFEVRLRRAGRPYGVEVVSDPYDVFAPGSVDHPLRPFFRYWSPRQLRRQCKGACAAAYVTEGALQHRYPPGSSAFSIHYTSAELPESAFVPAPRPTRRNHHTRTLITVGTLAQLYKAPHVLIDALGACRHHGLDLRLVLVGDGKHRPELEARVRALGCGERVRFLGQLPAGDAVRAQLDQADLFVLPSFQEGLPRAMLEAMARGLPCIGSTVGGIPELLPAEDMVPPGDVTALARKISAVVSDPERMARMSARNLAKAAQYRDEVLRGRRIAFYHHVRDATEAWLAGQKRF